MYYVTELQARPDGIINATITARSSLAMGLALYYRFDDGGGSIGRGNECANFHLDVGDDKSCTIGDGDGILFITLDFGIQLRTANHAIGSLDGGVGIQLKGRSIIGPNLVISFEDNRQVVAALVVDGILIVLAVDSDVLQGERLGAGVVAYL